MHRRFIKITKTKDRHEVKITCTMSCPILCHLPILWDIKLKPNLLGLRLCLLCNQAKILILNRVMLLLLFAEVGSDRVHGMNIHAEHDCLRVFQHLFYPTFNTTGSYSLSYLWMSTNVLFPWKRAITKNKNFNTCERLHKASVKPKGINRWLVNHEHSKMKWCFRKSEPIRRHE